jgi:flagellar L-ring protein precursor FlgH
MRSFVRSVLVAGVALAISGCNTLTRLSEVGTEPRMTGITNPTQAPGYRPVSLPMPTPQVPTDNPNSLWRPGAKAFFKDIRAKEVGDILTVKLRLEDRARLENKTMRGRDDSEALGVDAFLGYEASLSKVLPEAVNNEKMVGFDSETNTEGDGDINRKETIQLTVAAIVTQILPNGSLAIMGRQEVRVNYELRELMVVGVIRPQDIEADNTISHEKIAEMRMAYGGRGTLSDLQQPRWGTQVLDILLPF